MTGKQIRKLRKRLDMNQYQLAMRAKVSQALVSCIENDYPVSEAARKSVEDALKLAQRQESQVIAA